jgi:hypothetical protein
MFYTVLFTIPSINVDKCNVGFHIMNYIALLMILLTIFVIDLVNINQYIHKELYKL